MNKPIIEAQHIAKTYHDGALNVEVLRDLNFSINENESVSIIGASGSGKSTLLHILGGLDKPDSGSLKIIGQDLKTLSQAKLGALRNQNLGFVYQFHHLLAEFTALENVMMPLLIGKTPRKEAEARATAMLEKVGLAQRIQHRPAELSGGERQRAAIARALVRRPAVLVFDDSFSALDVATDSRLRAALRPATTGITKIIVAQRVSTITDADLILVLDEGRLAAKGTHEELLATSRTYREIVTSQLGSEAAA